MMRRIAKWVGVVILVLLVIPPVEVALARFWNPKGGPMHLERRIEAWAGGKPYHTEPMRWTPIDQIPVGLIHAIWASEDQNFFKHSGFDFWQMKQAIEIAQERGKAVRGASTISMQCARSAFLVQRHSYLRKAVEAYYTVWMELLLGKRRILEIYLNNIELGPGVYGVGAAANFHYGKTPMQLTKNEMFALAAILPNPVKWSPTHPNAIVQSKILRVQRLAARAPFPRSELQKK